MSDEMTDEELVRRLRIGVLGYNEAAADRIKALTKERDDAVIKRAAWELEAKTQQARAEQLSDKLAKAVEDLQDMLTIPNSEAAQGILKAYARALIAELTGGKGD